MITEDTVCILGAGASKPYGYPTSRELSEDIIRKLPGLISQEDFIKSIDSNTSTLLDLSLIRSMISDFANSHTNSIDLFLTRNKEYYYEVGTEMLTYLLIRYEQYSQFSDDIIDNAQDWYFEIFNLMTQEIFDPEKIHLVNNNKLSIITFNYDRSLEYFLYTSLYNSFLKTKEEAKAIMKKLKILHIYGKIAPLDWEEDGGYAYKSNGLKANIMSLSKNIRILYDQRSNETKEAENLIRAAQKIYFLGFGFADENIKALGFNNRILNDRQRIYGTAMGLTDREISRIKSKIKKNNDILDGLIRLENCDCLTLLRNYL